MNKPSDYKKALAVVGEVIRAWDPYCLIAEGASENEFDAEIEKLVAFIPKITNASTAATAISIVFSSAFEPEQFTPEHCATTGKQLFERLVASGLLSRA